MRRFHAKTDDQSGFTLVELLVVIVLIGVLAGIAIPLLLRTMQRSGDASAKSDLRNIAVQVEGYAADNPASYPTAAQLAATADTLPVSRDDAVYLFVNSKGFCMVGHSARAAEYHVYDSGNGGFQAPQDTLAAAQAACTTGGYTAAGSFVHDSSGLHVS